MSRRTGPRILTAVAAVTMVASVVGFIVMVMLNVFVFDEYDAYGEVSIPGSSTLQLPEGDVTVSFHTVVVGGGGSGLPVPPLKYRITGPDGADAQLTEDYGSTTTVNNDARVRIGYLHVAAAGAYAVQTDGNVSGYVNPRLAFGHGSGFGHLTVVFAAIFVLAIVDLVVARVWAARVRRSEPAADYPPPTPLSSPPPRPYSPTDWGIRTEQLKTLARLRDSGALTEDEYRAEKKRVLDGL